MKITDIKPYIRSVKEINGKFKETEMVTYDHCLLYFVKGSGEISVKEFKHQLSRGSLVILTPGQIYSLDTDSESLVLRINFDYIDIVEHGRKYPMSAVSKSQFDPKKVIVNIEFEDIKELNSSACLHNMHMLEEQILKIMAEFNIHNSYYKEMLSCMMQELIINIVRYKFGSKKAGSKSTDNMDRIINYIHEHYNEDINNETISRIFNYNSKYLSRVIKKLTGYSIYKYVIMRRISRTVYFLQETDMSISKISEEVGFHDVGHFSRLFKELMGTSPRGYRKMIRNMSSQNFKEASYDK